MGDINYLGGIVRILETPKIQLNENEIPSTKFRVQFPQVRKKSPSSIITIVIWGYLANDVTKYYRINDYILIEGYVSLRKSVNQKDIKKKSKYLQINLRKIFPLFLNTHASK
jgi:single-stranded DNA-binding protein